MLCKIINEIFNRNRTYKYDEIDYDNMKEIQKEDIKSILLDVRSPQEYKEGHLENSINIPFYDIYKNVRKKIPNIETTIIVYCQTGNRSKRVIDVLYKMGYKKLYNLKGGMDKI